MTQRGRGAGRSPSGARHAGAQGRAGQERAGQERAGQAGRPGAVERPRGDLAVRRAQLRTVVEPVVTAAGYDLEDLTVSRAGRRHVVRVVVDADGGINLDAVAVVSRAVSAALDAAEETGGELLAGEYQLEVSSPGVDRPLTLSRHWRRNVGRLVKVGAGDRQLTGRVVGADDDGIVLDVDGTGHEFGYAALGPGRVQVEFNRLDEISDADLDEVAGDADDADDDADADGEGDDADDAGRDLAGADTEFDDEDGEGEER